MIDNVVERQQSLVAAQFRKSPKDPTNLQKLVAVFSSSYQKVHKTLDDLKHKRNLDTAEGVQLDGLGQILGLPRQSGESDEDYRERLKFQTFINKGTATPEEMIDLLMFLTNATKIRYLELYPAAFQMITNGTTFPDPPNDIIDAIDKASPAGVQYTPVIATYGVEVPFVFGADAEFQLLGITDPNDENIITNLELDDSSLLYINPIAFSDNPEGGGFAEYGDPIDITGAGQLAEVIQYNGNILSN